MGMKHEQKSKIKYKIDKVGIINLRLPIKIKREDVNIQIIPKISAFIDFDSDNKGIHMSRIQTSVIETINTTSNLAFIEDMGKRILKNIEEKVKFKNGEVILEFPYALKRKTPVSNYEIREVHDVVIRIFKKDSTYYKTITCKVVGNSVCICEGHMQRSYLTVSMTTKLETEVLFRDLVEAADNSFSCPVSSIVRTEDEKHMAKRMRENPRFVETLVRLCLHNLIKVCKKKKIKGRVKIEAVSEDSIHLHNVYAEIEEDLK